ncbi:unnamed protein product [Clonostachys rosea]|uniref:Zinc-binding domain-containing protein n=1 Tax=Bionectria ochroleuca TaxID=29856 RepID=A0ABY6USC2_BIOOC|nr:unnamed protein product [Clonostachys rosea]
MAQQAQALPVIPGNDWAQSVAQCHWCWQYFPVAFHTQMYCLDCLDVFGRAALAAQSQDMRVQPNAGLRNPAHDPFLPAFPGPALSGPQVGLAEPMWALPPVPLDTAGALAQVEVSGGEPVPEAPASGTISPATADEDVREPVPEATSSGTVSPATADGAAPDHLHCSTCKRWKPVQDFARPGRNPYSTCSHCREMKSQYAQQGSLNPDGTPPATQRCTACHEDRPVEDFDPTVTFKRKCRRCRDEGRRVAPVPKTSPSKPSKRSQAPEVPGKSYCSGCSKILDDELFISRRFGKPRQCETCTPCRERKQEADRRKRERREAEEGEGAGGTRRAKKAKKADK